MRFFKYVLCLFIGILCLSGVIGRPVIKRDKDTSPDKRFEWWYNVKFGMFIHWGLYSELAGEWKGQSMTSLVTGVNTEQIDRHLKIPNVEYEAMAKYFNPIAFDAKEWVRVAKDAGMRYLVITAKHQEGFAMYKSASSDYNIVDATPFDRDPIKELSEECKEAGIKFGVYYSHARDYHEPGANWNSHGNTWDYPNQTQDDFEKYFYGKVFSQVRELLTNYGEIAVLWFDVPYKLTPKMSKDLRDLVISLQPDCLINSRIGNDFGDYKSMPDRKIVDESTDFPWETCATINKTWGYSKYDHDWKPVDELIYNLVDITSKGGNYLLNVGPTGEGIIPEPSVEILKQMGDWLDVNGEAIYETKNIKDFENGEKIRFTKSGDEAALYAITFEWPSSVLRLENSEISRVSKVYLVGYKKPLKWSKVGSGIIEISIPEKLKSEENRPCSYAWTFKIEY